MIRSVTLLSLFLFSILYSSAVPQISPADRNILQRFYQYANENQLTAKTVNERVPFIALFFLDTPYKSNTLNVTKEELPIINLRELDCVTFIENVLALAYLTDYNKNSFQEFVQHVVQLRYRNGEIEDYCSRLHYSTDWLYEMQRQNLLTDITLFAGGVPYAPDVYYMSKNYERYPPLKQNKKLREKIKDIETRINQRTYYYIPKAQVNEACHKIKNGDIILITTNIKGLDTSHLGFALKKNGQTYLLHASSQGKKVMISEVPLQEYMEGIPTQNGIMVARTLKIIPSPKEKRNEKIGTGIDNSSSSTNKE